MFDSKQLQVRLEVALGPEVTRHHVTFRPMFGGITGYARGRNFVSLSNVGLALKLDAPDRERLLAVAGAKPLQYEPQGPVSKSSVVVPKDMLNDDAQLRNWALKSIVYCEALPKARRRPRR